MSVGLRSLFGDSENSLTSEETILSSSSGDLTPSTIKPLETMENTEQKSVSFSEEPQGAAVSNAEAEETKCSSTTLESLKIRRRYYRGNLTKAITKFQSIVDAAGDAAEILGAHSSVRLRYNDLWEIESKIQKLSPVESLEEEISSFSPYEDNYAETLEFVEQLKFNESQNTPLNSTYTTRTEMEQKEVKLQSLTLPKFTGKEDSKIDFFEFLELFSVVTEKYSTTAKAVLLKNHVSYPAASSFGGIIATAENFPVMVEKLTQKYGSPEIRMNKYVRKLLEFTPPKAPPNGELSAKAMRSIVDEISTIVRNLRLIDAESLTSENFMIALIQLKLPQRILIELNLGRDPTATYNLDELFDAIENSVRSREMAEMSDKRYRDGNFAQ